jgi:tRNA pseudouridine13 synthase
MNLPYLTPDFPGIGGSIKQRPEDFFVQEIPLYEPSGEGEHVYAEIQKVGLSTFDVVHRLAQSLNVPTRDIGYAGLKDARAVTRQVFSILGVTEQAVMNLKIPGVQVQWAARHGNKLRLGHLAANRFAVKIRDVNPTDVVKLRPVLDVFEKRGMPNFFGEQRFGRRGNNDQLGAALVRGDNVGLLKLLLGSPDPALDDKHSLKARKLFDERQNDESMKQWPRRCGMERRVLARLIKTKKPGSAIRAIDEKLRRLWVSALQSKLFNDVLIQRLESIDKLMDGDLAYKHDNGACFKVEQASVEQARCDAFEISPTGPLLGYRMSVPGGAPLKIEQSVFGAAGLTAGEFKHADRERVKGARRPLRVKPENIELAAGVDEHGGHITVAFTLPAGSFATVLLGELMKPAETAAPEEEENESTQEDQEQGESA